MLFLSSKRAVRQPTYDSTIRISQTKKSLSTTLPNRLKQVASTKNDGIPSLSTLASEIFAKNVLLYERLGEIPASIKAPAFIRLLARDELTPEHLAVLLSTDQRRLDLSCAPRSFQYVIPTALLARLTFISFFFRKDFISMNHINVVSKICKRLEHLNLSGCALLGGAILPNVQTIAACGFLTFLDLSYVAAVSDVSSVALHCSNIQTLRLSHCSLNPRGLCPRGISSLQHLQELDISYNSSLSPPQIVWPLLPGTCPSLQRFKASYAGSQYRLSSRFASHHDRFLG